MNLKKLLALILALMMVLSSLPMAFAEEVGYELTSANVDDEVLEVEEYDLGAEGLSLDVEEEPVEGEDPVEGENPVEEENPVEGENPVENEEEQIDLADATAAEDVVPEEETIETDADDYYALEYSYEDKEATGETVIIKVPEGPFDAIRLSTIIEQYHMDVPAPLNDATYNKPAKDAGYWTVVSDNANLLTVTALREVTGTAPDIAYTYDYVLTPQASWSSTDEAAPATVTVTMTWQSNTVEVTAGQLVRTIKFTKATQKVFAAYKGDALVGYYGDIAPKDATETTPAVEAATAFEAAIADLNKGADFDKLVLLKAFDGPAKADLTIQKPLTIDLNGYRFTARNNLYVSGTATVVSIENSSETEATFLFALNMNLYLENGSTFTVDDPNVRLAFIKGEIIQEAENAQLKRGLYLFLGKNKDYLEGMVAEGYEVAGQIKVVKVETNEYSFYQVTPSIAITYMLKVNDGEFEPWVPTEENTAVPAVLKTTYNNVDGIAGSASLSEPKTTDENSKDIALFSGWYTAESMEAKTAFAKVDAGAKDPKPITLYGTLKDIVATVDTQINEKTNFASFAEAAEAVVRAKQTGDTTITIVKVPAEDDTWTLGVALEKSAANKNDAVTADENTSLKINPPSNITDPDAVKDFVWSYLKFDEGAWAVDTTAVAPEYRIAKGVATVTVGGESTRYTALTGEDGALQAAMNAARSGRATTLTILDVATAAKETGTLTLETVDSDKLTLEFAEGKMDGLKVVVGNRTTLNVKPIMTTGTPAAVSYAPVENKDIDGYVPSGTNKSTSKLVYGENTYTYEKVGTANTAADWQWKLSGAAATVYTNYDADKKAYTGYKGTYATLQEAVAKAETVNASFVVVEKDLTTDKQVAITKAMTIDLNGHSVTGSAAYTFNINGEKVILKNGSVDNTEASSQTSYTVYVAAGELELEAVKVSKSRNYAIYMKAGTITFKDADTGTQDKPRTPADDEYVRVNGKMHLVGTSKATSGFFTDLDTAKALVAQANVTGENAKYALTANAPEGETGDWYQVVEGTVSRTVGATVTWYATLPEAVAAVEDAKNKPETITLTEDVVLTETIPVNKSFTLKMEGKNIYFNKGTVFTIADKAALTVAAGTSTIYGGIVSNGGNLTLNSGIGVCNVEVEYDKDANDGNGAWVEVMEDAKQGSGAYVLSNELESKGEMFVFAGPAITMNGGKLTLAGDGVGPHIVGENAIVMTAGELVDNAGYSVAYAKNEAIVFDSSASGKAITATLKGIDARSIDSNALVEKDNGTKIPEIFVKGGRFWTYGEDEDENPVDALVFSDAFAGTVNAFKNMDLSDTDAKQVKKTDIGVAGGTFSTFVEDDFTTRDEACYKNGGAYVVGPAFYIRYLTDASWNTQTQAWTTTVDKVDKVNKSDSVKGYDADYIPKKDGAAFKEWHLYVAPADLTKEPAANFNPIGEKYTFNQTTDQTLIAQWEEWMGRIDRTGGTTEYYSNVTDAIKAWINQNTWVAVGPEKDAESIPDGDLILRADDKEDGWKLTGDFHKITSDTVIAKAFNDQHTRAKTVNATGDELRLEVVGAPTNAEYEFEAALVANLYNAGELELDGEAITGYTGNILKNASFTVTLQPDEAHPLPASLKDGDNVPVEQYSTDAPGMVIVNGTFTDGNIVIEGVTDLTKNLFHITDYVAYVVGAPQPYYADLRDALIDADGDRVVLLKDIELEAEEDWEEPIVIGDDYYEIYGAAIYLNGHTISAKGNVFQVTGSELYIRDSAKDIMVRTYIEDNQWKYERLGIFTDPETPGAIVSTGDVAITVSGDGELYVYGGDITGTAAAISTSGNKAYVSINNGARIKSEQTAKADLVYDETANTYYVSGGKFSKPLTTQLCSLAHTYPSTNTDIKDVALYPYSVSTYDAVKIGDYFYASINDAIKAIVAKDAKTETINVARSFTEQEQTTNRNLLFPAGYDITLDLNGFTVTVQPTAAAPMIRPDETVKAGVDGIDVEGTLTLKDSGKKSNANKTTYGKLIGATVADSEFILVEKGGTLNVDASIEATINKNGENDAAIVSKGTVNVLANEANDFAIEATNTGAKAKALVIDNTQGAAAASIKGGKFENAVESTSSKPKTNKPLEGFIEGGKFKVSVAPKENAPDMVKEGMMCSNSPVDGYYIIGEALTVTLTTGVLPKDVDAEKDNYGWYVLDKEDDTKGEYKHEVSFKVLSGEKLDDVTKFDYYNGNFEIPNNVLAGWLDTTGKDYDSSKPVTNNITLSAKYDVQRYNVLVSTEGITYSEAGAKYAEFKAWLAKNGITVIQNASVDGSTGILLLDVPMGWSVSDVLTIKPFTFINPADEKETVADEVVKPSAVNSAITGWKAKKNKTDSTYEADLEKIDDKAYQVELNDAVSVTVGDKQVPVKKYIAVKAVVTTNANQVSITLIDGTKNYGTYKTDYGTVLSAKQLENVLKHLLVGTPSANINVDKAPDNVSAKVGELNAAAEKNNKVLLDDELFTNVDSIVLTSDMVFALNWIDMINVTYKWNDGTEDKESVKKYAVTTKWSEITDAPDLDPEGGNTAVWTDAEGNKIDFTSEEEIGTKDLVLTGKIENLKDMTVTLETEQSAIYDGKPHKIEVTLTDPDPKTDSSVKVEYRKKDEKGAWAGEWTTEAPEETYVGEYTYGVRVSAVGYNPVEETVTLKILSKYNVKYVLNGGTNDDKNPTEVAGDEKVTLLDATKQYSTFDGWYTDADFTNKVTELDGSKLDGDVTLYAKFTKVEVLFQRSLNLADSIGINAYINNIPEDADLSKVYVVNSATGEKSAMFSTMTKTANGYKIEVANLAARYMMKETTLTLYCGDEILGAKAFSVRDYCDAAIEKGGAIGELAKACLNYGAASQLYFDHETDNLANSNAGYAVKDPADVPATYEATGDPTLASVEKVSVSVALEYATELNVYFTPASGYTTDDLTVTVTDKNGAAVTSTATKSGSMLKVNVKNIGTSKLGDEYSFKVTDKDGNTATWKRSCMNYCYTAFKNGKPNTKLVAQRLCEFYAAYLAYDASRKG